MVTSDRYMNAMQEIEEHNCERIGEKEQARIQREEAKRKNLEEREERRLRREAHQWEVAEERLRKLMEREAAARARAAAREEVACQKE